MKKLKPLKSGFIENSNFENNRDPCIQCISIADSVKKAFRFHFLWLQFYLSKSIILFTGIVSFRCDISPNLIELFWNNTKSLRFVLPLRISTIALSSVLILKKMPSVLTTSTTMLFIQID